MSELKDSGAKREFGTGAHRDANNDKGRFDLLPVTAIEKLAKLYQKGAAKYGENNWQKGVPLSVYFDSALRHTFKALRGDADEDHLVAAAWNLICAIETRDVINKTEKNICVAGIEEALRRIGLQPPLVECGCGRRDCDACAYRIHSYLPKTA
jgi:hypothetical protein